MTSGVLVAICIWYDQKREKEAKEAEGKVPEGMQKVQQTDDLELTTDVNVTHF